MTTVTCPRSPAHHHDAWVPQIAGTETLHPGNRRRSPRRPSRDWKCRPHQTLTEKYGEPTKPVAAAAIETHPWSSLSLARFSNADLKYLYSMIWIGLGVALVGFLLGRYTINPSFPDGAYAGMTRHNWRTLGRVMISLGAACAIYGFVLLI